MTQPTLTMIRMTDIIPNASQPRSTFGQQALIELADSIRAHGVLEPILVVQTGTYYKVIAGERRYRAATMAGLSTIPAMVLHASPKELHEIAIIENLQRQNLNPVEEALAIRALIDQYNMTQDEVARSLGRSRPAIANLLRILTLPAEVQSLVQQGKLSQGHARALLALPTPKAMIAMANRCIDNRWSVHALTQAIQAEAAPKVKTAPKRTAKPRPISVELRALVDDMEHVFEMPIKVQGDDTKGTLTISYHSTTDLQRIYDLLERLRTTPTDQD